MMSKIIFYCLFLPFVVCQSADGSSCDDLHSDQTILLQRSGDLQAAVIKGESDVHVDGNHFRSQLQFAERVRSYWEQKGSTIVATQTSLLDASAGDSATDADRRVLREQLHADLELAKESRLHWEKRVSALQQALAHSSNAQLQTSNKTASVLDAEMRSNAAKTELLSNEKESMPAILVEPKHMFLMCVCAIIPICILFFFERRHDDDSFLLKILAAVVVFWFCIGMLAFAVLFQFTDEPRHLDLAESVYLSAQIMTTVGYGDLTPTTNAGMVFVMFYAATGVGIIASILQEAISNMIEKPAHHLGLDRHLPKDLARFLDSFVPLILCLIFGTMFFHHCHGEEWPLLEASYLSVITLLSIGFGVYHPKSHFGKLIAAVWMIIGVTFMSRAVMWLAHMLFEYKHGLKSIRRAKVVLKEIEAKGKDSIDCFDFLEFELVRGGLSPHHYSDALAAFCKLGVKKSGSLDMHQFQEYVELNMPHT